MKKIWFLFILFSYFVLPFSSLYANDDTIEQINEIASFEHDVTGDGVMEELTLRGSFLSEHSSFYHDIWIDITSRYSDKWKISFASGYEPKVQFIHLTSEKTADIFYSVRKTEHKTPMTHQLYSLRNGKVTQLPLPKANRMSGTLQDQFQASVALDGHDTTSTIELTNVKQKLMEQSLYDESGKLKRQLKVLVQPISSLQPILLNKNKGYGLKSVQLMMIEQTDIVIGTIESIWYFERDDWVRLKTNYKKR